MVAPRTVCFTEGEADKSRLVSEKYAGTCSKVAKVPRYAVRFVRQFQPDRWQFPKTGASNTGASLFSMKELIITEKQHHKKETRMQIHRRAFAYIHLDPPHQVKCKKCKREVAFYENRTHI